MNIPSRIYACVCTAAVVGVVAASAGPAVAGDDADNNQTNAKQADGAKADGKQADGKKANEDQADGEQAGKPSLRRGNRMEFDARLIRGESAGSGAVFLFERSQRPLPSLIHKRKSFLKGTVDSVLGDDWAEKFAKARRQDHDSD